MMNLDGLRRRCEARLKDLELPVPFDTQAFCDTLARQRGRPIVLQPAACGTGYYGLWVATRDTDVVYYERDTSALHQKHIILHEICHLLCGHQSTNVTDPAAQQLLFPDLQTAAMRHTLQRAGYSTDEEREAELLASLILDRAERAAAVVPDSAESTIERLGSVLEEGPQPRQ